MSSILRNWTYGLSSSRAAQALSIAWLVAALLLRIVVSSRSLRRAPLMTTVGRTMNTTMMKIKMSQARTKTNYLLKVKINSLTSPSLCKNNRYLKSSFEQRSRLLATSHDRASYSSLLRRTCNDCLRVMFPAQAYHTVTIARKAA